MCHCTVALSRGLSHSRAVRKKHGVRLQIGTKEREQQWTGRRGIAGMSTHHMGEGDSSQT